MIIEKLSSKCQRVTEQEFELSTKNIQIEEEVSFSLLVGVITVIELPFLCLVDQCEPAGSFINTQIYCVKGVRYFPFQSPSKTYPDDEEETGKVLGALRQRILINNFYFCYGEDITLTYEKKYEEKATAAQYFWNEDLLRIFYQHKMPPCWKVPMMQGFVSEIYFRSDYFVCYYLNISRRSKFMSGTRFNSRGIDFQGNASNYVETEQIAICHNFIFSHVSIRGSAPILWQQKGFSAEIEFPSQSLNSEKIDLHYQSLSKEYSSEIVTVNLLSNKSPEKQLKNKFEFYYNSVVKGKYLCFDFNQENKQKIEMQKLIGNFVLSHRDILVGKTNYFCMERSTRNILCKQRLVPRINCLDCVDRTNVIMARISELYLKQVEFFINSSTQIEQKKLNFTQDFYLELISTWTNLGNRISLIYCGVESTASHLTQKQNDSFFSSMSSAFNKFNRYYHANVNDALKQECLNYLLDKFPSHSFFYRNIASSIVKQSQYCTYHQIGVFNVTWNCNILDPTLLTAEQLNKMLCFSSNTTGIVVVCLQEIVELNSYNVVLGNHEAVVENWKKVVWNHINVEGEEYDYLAEKDLVGIATFVFISRKLKDRVRKLEELQVKTGFKGSLGNKGAIAVFLEIDSSILAIINCHLAAGETKANERIQDIQYIHQEIIKQRKIRQIFNDCEFRFLIGDLNFRLESKNENVREILYSIEKHESHQKLSDNDLSLILGSLLSQDQFRIHKTSKSFLSFYNEGPIFFLPTYKYIKKQSTYDSKRTPSWCDRILFHSLKKQKLKVLSYFTAEIYESDHKPVTGTFSLLCKSEDEKKKNSLIEEYLQVCSDQ